MLHLDDQSINAIELKGFGSKRNTDSAPQSVGVEVSERK